MNQVNKLQQLVKLSYFDKATLAQVLEVKDKALAENIRRWLKQNKLVALKKGLYVTNQYWQNVSDRQNYLEFIASILRQPSYLSLEYVLQKYGVLTEEVFEITSVTLKTKRIYVNDLGRFSYRKINERLFVGFQQKTMSGYKIYEASKAKALFDYLYLKLYRKKIDNPKEIVSDFRLNLDAFDQADWQEWQKYCQLTDIKKFQLLGERMANDYS